VVFLLANLSKKKLHICLCTACFDFDAFFIIILENMFLGERRKERERERERKKTNPFFLNDVEFLKFSLSFHNSAK